MNNRSASSRLSRTLNVGLLFTLIAGSIQAEWTIRQVIPTLTEPEETVTLHGTGFDPEATYTVEVGSLSATVTEVTTISIKFTAPIGFTAGQINVSDGERDVIAPEPLAPLRSVSGTLNLPSGVNPSDYLIMAGVEFVGADAEGKFEITRLPANRLIIVVAFNPDNESDSAFYAPIFPDQTEFTIDANSTTSSLALLHPALMTRFPTPARARIESSAQQSGFSQIVSLIETTSAPGVDYLLDGRIQTHLQTVINATITDLQSSPASLPPLAALPSTGPPTAPIIQSLFNAAPTLGDDVSFAGGEILRKNQIFTRTPPTDRLSLSPTVDLKKREVAIEIRPDVPGFQPVDWYVEAYQISSTNYQTITEVRNLPGDFEPRLINGKKPVFSSYVRADLITAELDLLETLTTWITEKVTKLEGPSATMTFSLDDPGLYVVQAYSGNIYYGIENFLPNPNLTDQADLLNKYDVNGLWKWAGASNAFAVTIDYISTIMAVKELLRDDCIDLTQNQKLIEDFLAVYESMMTNFAKSIVQASIETPGGQPSQARINEIMIQIMQSKLQAILGILGNAVKDQIGKIVDPSGWLGKAKVGFKTVLKTIDILGKISTFGQATQRLDGLAGGGTRALERFIVVVDNPFRPYATQVEPAFGHSGTVLRILGENFTSGEDISRILSVSFCTFPDNDTTQEADHELSAKVLSVERGVIRAQVPDTWATEFGSERRAYVCITSTDGAEFHSGKFHAPFRFEYVPDMEITGVGYRDTPSVLHNEKQLYVHVNSLGGLNIRDIDLRIFNAEGTDLTPDGAIISATDGNTLTVAFSPIAPLRDDAPTTYTARLQGKTRIHDPEDNSFTDEVRPATPIPFSFAVTQAPLPTLGPGLQLEVSSLSNVIAEDGELTLMEALIIASQGTAGLPNREKFLGTPLCETVNALNPCPKVKRDSDHILNPGEFTITNPDDLNPALNPAFETTPPELSGGGGLDADRVFLSDEILEFLAENPEFVWSPDRALPPLNSGDTIFLSNLTIDGTNAGPTPALQFNDVQGVTVQEVNFQNFPGDGVLFSGSSSTGASTSNLLFRVNLSNLGGRGIVFQGHATSNILRAVKVNVTEGDVLLFDGANASSNTVEPNISTTFSLFSQFSGSKTGYGVHVKGGSTGNRIRFNEASDNQLGGIRIDDASANLILGAAVDAFAHSPTDNVVANNGGHGIHISGASSEILIRYCNIYGNTGDGIRIDGAGSTEHTIMGIQTGIGTNGLFENFLSRNTGNGLYIGGGAKDIQVGNPEHRRFPPRRVGTGGDDDRNYFYSNMLNGIHIHGSDTTGHRIQTSFVGGSTFGIDRTNGANNLLISNGAHRNAIGGLPSMWATRSTSTGNISTLDYILACRFINAANGAGILLDDAHNNSIIGCEFSGNKIGVHLRNGSSNNQIGTPGDINDLAFEKIFLGPVDFPEESTTLFRPFNFFAAHTEACIWVENSGATITEGFVPLNPNVFQGNMLGMQNEKQGALPSDVGLKITGTSYGNIFGGPEASSGNRFDVANLAGVLIEGVTYPTPDHRNYFRNNLFKFNGLFRRGDFDARTITPPGVALLIKDSDKIIFGESSKAPNTIQGNNYGVYLENTTNSTIRGNIIQDSRYVGHIIRGGSNNQIGGSLLESGNQFFNNGNADVIHDGALMLAATSGNKITGNLFGEIEEKEREPTDRRLGNKGSSIYLFNAFNNVIGAPEQNGGNTIVQNEGPGIHLEGAASTGNHIINNRIGALDENAMPASQDYLANDGAGILLEAGASQNTIGGFFDFDIKGSTVKLPMRNTIARSGGAGIQIEGATSTGNTITNNSITGNTGAGILLSNGGNGNQTLATTTEYDGETLRSTSVDLAAVPPGSIIQVFGDTASGSAEGFNFVGQTTVRDDGTWEVPGLGYVGFRALSTTVTNSATGSTSGFSETPINPAYSISRNGDATPSSGSFPLSASSTTILALDVAAGTTNITFSQLVLTASGSIDESVIISGVEVYWDSDTNGIHSPSDILLGGPATFATDDGTVTISLNRPTLRPGETQTWLVVYKFSENPQVSQDLVLKLISAADIVATLPASSVSATAVNSTFPVVSDTLVASVAQPPTITSHPLSRAVLENTSVSFSVTASGEPPLSYQWARNGTPILDATATRYTIDDVASADAGSYSAIVTNNVGSTASQSAALTVTASGTLHATHHLDAPGYNPGRILTLTHSLSYVGTATSLQWTSMIPPGWAFVSDSGSAASTKPAPDATGTLSWTWTAIPSSPHSYTYRVSVPENQMGEVQIAGLVDLQSDGTDHDLLALPDPLVLGPASKPPHSADTDSDYRLSLSELLRVIELYNTRRGTTRTGRYKVQSGTGDGFGTDVITPDDSTDPLAAYHDADTSQDARLSLSELLRVIELYNFRTGTSRTGRYRPETGTPDGFSPGP